MTDLILPERMAKARRKQKAKIDEEGKTAAEIEHKRVHFLKEDTQLYKELGLYEGKVISGGAIRYSAPSGYFDDCVIAAALAIDKLKRRRNTSRSAMRGDYLSFGASRSTW